MKLLDVIIFSLAVAFFIIGVHQTFLLGFAGSYWIFMLTGILLLVYQWRKKNASATAEEAESKPQVSKPSRPTSKNKNKPPKRK